VKAREEKAKTEGILDAIGDAISIQDTDFKVIYQNQLHKDIMEAMSRILLQGFSEKGPRLRGMSCGTQFQ